MRYLMLVWVGAAAAESADGPDTVAPWVAEMDRRGIRQLGARLRPAEDTTTLRLGTAGVLVSDGPYAESKEQIGGFDLLDCADLDEALEVAGRYPIGPGDVLELRPLWE